MAATGPSLKKSPPGKNSGSSSSPNASEHHVQACKHLILHHVSTCELWGDDMAIHGLYLGCHSSPYPPTCHLVKPIVTLTPSLRLVMALKPAKVLLKLQVTNCHAWFRFYDTDNTDNDGIANGANFEVQNRFIRGHLIAMVMMSVRREAGCSRHCKRVFNVWYKSN